MSVSPLLSVRGLRTELESGEETVVPVQDVSFDLYPHETLGIVGESGCGKSMTAYSIMRLLPVGGRVAAGEILFDGRDLTSMSQRQLRAVRGNDIGLIFQDPMTALNPTMTVFDQIAEPLRIHTDLRRAAIRDRVIEVLGLVGVPRPAERLSNYPHQFSGGMRQRVAIATALTCQPKVLIADEPTTALDVTIQRQILELIDDLREKLGMAVILVTHNLGVIASHTDRVAVMYAGQIVETATTAELFDAPRHQYTNGLFGALPERAATRHDRLVAIGGAPPDLAHPPQGCRFAPRCAAATDECRAAVPSVQHVTTTHAFACLHPVPPAGEARPTVRIGAVEDRAAAPEQGTDAIDDVLVVDRIVKHYSTSGPVFGGKARVSAVEDVSFSVGEGETFGLVGESGCGKSTVARLITALERPTAGRIEVLGGDLFAAQGKALRQRRRHVQLMFQDSSAAVDRRFRAADIVREPLLVQQFGSRESQDENIAQLLDQVGLPRRIATRYPHELSGGQEQRLALARSLALRPKLIVADEPVSALDVSVQAQILNLMRDVQREYGVSYVFISHDLSVVRYISERVGVMYLGKLVETGATEDVYERPIHPYTRGLIDAAPTANIGAATGTPIQGELPSPVDPPSGCRFRTRCPYAQDVCAAVAPPMLEHAPGQFAACHFPLHSDRSSQPSASMATMSQT